MSLGEGADRAPASERGGARAKSRSRGLADIDPKFISQVRRKFVGISNIEGSSLLLFETSLHKLTVMSRVCHA